MPNSVIEESKKYIERKSFSKIKSGLELPNLIEVQLESFKWFLNEGIMQILNETSPINDFSGNLSMEFIDCEVGEPAYTPFECKEKDLNYSARLNVLVRLSIHETIDGVKQLKEIKEQHVFLGDIPIMTPAGTFIINGSERVIVSQLVRSPSVYFGLETDKSGRKVYNCNIIPNRGTWLEFELDSKDIINIRIDRTRKMPATLFMRVLGLVSDASMTELFGDYEILKNTLSKDDTPSIEEALISLYEKLRPGEPATVDSSRSLMISRFFDDRRYDLSSVGRYKFNKKLNVLERLQGQILAQDIKIGDSIIAKDGDLITPEVVAKIEPVLNEGYGMVEVKLNNDLDTNNRVQIIEVYSPADNDGKRKVKVIGCDQSINCKHITISDIIASLSYYLNIQEGIGKTDEIDHLGNRRIRSVGELLQNQFRIGLTRMERVVKERMSTQEIDVVAPKSLINIRPITAVIKEFFGSSQLSQFMDQTNPLAELTHKRRVSALGPGGLTRDRAGLEVRDVHYSHYGRICPIETPEGTNIGLISSLASYARINQYGFVQTPYRKVVDLKVTNTIKYLTADEEKKRVVAQANIKMDENNNILEDNIVARYRGENILVNKNRVDFVDVSPKQIVSIVTACIPFLEHDDPARALLGANMQRQALPLLSPKTPRVGTGMEHKAIKDSGVCIICGNDGSVEYVDSKVIRVRSEKGVHEYKMIKYGRSNQGTSYNQVPIVKVGDMVKKGDILADGPSCENGQLALGQDVKVAFMTWNGYNYEDAVIISERLVKDDIYTSIHIESYEIECRATKLGDEEITRDIPNVSESSIKYLDDSGIIMIGSEVKDGDILVGKVTPKGVTDLSSEERLLHAIFGEKTREVRDTSLSVPHGSGGVVHDVKVFKNTDKGVDLSPGVNKVVRVYIAQKRKISVGDKMAGRHGNKGVISLVLPEEDMPYMADGTAVDIMLNPLGVPSRMNIGQILELHLGMAAESLDLYISTPVFEGATKKEIYELMEKAGLDSDGKTDLYDGRTGEKFDNRVAVGIMHMIKLAHMVDDKLHARSTGPYSLVTQQPLGGKAQFGGQRFGEMEVWALEAYGAAHTLQEILTVKSDDIMGRVKVYESLVKGETVPQPGIPESFRVLVKELQSLALDVTMLNENNEEVELIDNDDFTTNKNSFEREEIQEVLSEKVIDEEEMKDNFINVLAEIENETM
ncbi:MAG: DNA-directed RNA polymerase subunit beta [Bacilli bacterium]